MPNLGAKVSIDTVDILYKASGATGKQFLNEANSKQTTPQKKTGEKMEEAWNGVERRAFVVVPNYTGIKYYVAYVWYSVLAVLPVMIVPCLIAAWVSWVLVPPVALICLNFTTRSECWFKRKMFYTVDRRPLVAAASSEGETS